MIKQATLLVSIVLGSCLVGRADELADLQKQQVETLQQAVRQIEAQYRAGEVAIEQLLVAQSTLLDAQLEMAVTHEMRLDVLTQQLKLKTMVESEADARYRAGLGKKSDYLFAKAARLRVEILLVKEKRLGG